MDTRVSDHSLHDIPDFCNEIEKRSVILTSGSSAAEYTGIALFNHLISVLGDGFAAGEGASYAFTGSQKVVGISDNIFTYLLNEGTNANNYNITTIFGNLTINSRADDPYKASANEEDDSRYESVKSLHVIVTILLAVIAVVVFFLTEDLTNTMALIDKYTILMAIILIVAVVTIFTGKRKSENTEEKDDLN